MKKKIWLIILLTLLLTSCGGSEAAPTSMAFDLTLAPTNLVADPLVTQTPLPGYFPQPGDNELTRAKVLPESIDLLSTETIPQQISVLISGYLPTPCHLLRAKIARPDAKNNIHIELYSLADPEADCPQTLRAFNEGINLGSFPAGSYWVWVNGEKVGNFDF